MPQAIERWLAMPVIRARLPCRNPMRPPKGCQCAGRRNRRSLAGMTPRGFHTSRHGYSGCVELDDLPGFERLAVQVVEALDGRDADGIVLRDLPHAFAGPHLVCPGVVRRCGGRGGCGV